MDKTMKLIGKILLPLSLLLFLVIVFSYMLIQTRWGADYASRWISSRYNNHLSIGHIKHRWLQPTQLVLSQVHLSNDKQADTLDAEEISIDFNWHPWSSPGYIERLTVSNGSVDTDQIANQFPLLANQLVLNKVNVTGHVANWMLNGQQINAGITPWQPQPTHLLAEQSQFQLSASQLTVNGITASNVLIQGSLINNKFFLSNFGADLSRGQLTGKARQLPDNSWVIDNLRLSNVRFQTPQTLSEFLSDFSQLPKLNITRLDLLGGRVQGQDWAFSDVDLSLKNVIAEQGSLSGDGGEVSLSATDLINGNLHFRDPIINLDINPQGIVIKQLNGRWEKGLFRANGNWTRANKRLQFDEMTLVGLEYTLPENWRQLWQQPLPNWVSEIALTKLLTSRNLIIDINPDFPFQITSLDGNGDNLLLAKNNQWGIWGGKLTLTASEATFNKVDIRHPSLSLQADDNNIKFNEISTFVQKGLLEANASIAQQAQRAITLHLTGQAVPANVLQSWGWGNVPLTGDANLQLSLQGNIPANSEIKPTLNGVLQVNDGEGKQLQQQMINGAITGQ
jgi:hypothetical protein